MAKKLIRAPLSNLSDGDRRVTGFIPVRMAWRLRTRVEEEAR